MTRVVIQFRYLTGFRETIGMAAVLNRDDTWKCYIGTCPGKNEHFDRSYVADLGAKVPEDIAKTAFPMIDKKYEY
jgi:hypothetical protein